MEEKNSDWQNRIAFIFNDHDPHAEEMLPAISLKTLMAHAWGGGSTDGNTGAGAHLICDEWMRARVCAFA